VPEAVDCGYWNAECIPGLDWPCSGGTTVGPCGDVAGEYHCAGSFVYDCVGGDPRGWDCQGYKGTCDESIPGAASCTLSQTTCPDLDYQVCSGNSLTYCNSDGYYYQYDCSITGGACETSTAGDNCYMPGCSANNCVESCNGSVMTLCIGNAPMIVDCLSYGFNSCTTYNDSSGIAHPVCLR
jgi:hypothetical protein